MKKSVILFLSLLSLTACKPHEDSSCKTCRPEKPATESCVGSLNNLNATKQVALKAYQLQKQCNLNESLMLQVIAKYDTPAKD